VLEIALTFPPIKKNTINKKGKQIIMDKITLEKLCEEIRKENRIYKPKKINMKGIKLWHYNMKS
jgi:hypothetical protein